MSEMAELQRRGHQLLLVTRPGALIADRARAAGLEVRLLPFSGKGNLSTIIPLRRWIREGNYQIVNTHSGIDSWIGMFATRGTRVKLIRTRHLNIPLKRSWHNFVHYAYDRVITCGEVMRDRLINDCGFSPEQLVSIPTGIDFDAFHPMRRREEVRVELGATRETFLVLMVGIVRSVKGHDLALKAFAEFRAIWPDACLVIAGDGPKLSESLVLAEKLGIAQNVAFLGFRDDIADLMNAADVLLLSSRSEGIPQAVTQAMGTGLPVVATAVGGVPELISDGMTGILVPPNDAESMSIGLMRVADERRWANGLGRRAKAFVRGRYSLARMCDATEQLYQETLFQGH